MIERGGVVISSKQITFLIKFSQHFVVDILEAMGFSKRYPGADVTAFLRVRNDSDEGGDFEGQVLFDQWTYPNYTAEGFLSGEVTPLVVENRGSKSAVSVVSLTEDMTTIAVSSFNPRVKSLVSFHVFGRRVHRLAAHCIFWSTVGRCWC